MTSRRRIPNELNPIFAVHEALDLGISRSRLNAADLARPFHGVRVPCAFDDSLELRCRALLTRMRPGDAFCGPTAARLWGMPIPLRLEATPVLHVSSLHPVRALRREGVIGSSRRSHDAVTRQSLPLLGVWQTCQSMASMLTVDELTCAIDFVITGRRRRAPLSSLAELASYLDARRHSPGIGSVREAAAQSRAGAWSSPETITRLLLVRAGIPEPELNVSLPLPDGRSVIPDLAWREFRVATEYNGGHHDEPDQRLHDLRRIDDFTDIDWVTVNVEKRELFTHPDSVVLRVARRLIDRGWHPPAGFQLPKSTS